MHESTSRNEAIIRSSTHEGAPATNAVRRRQPQSAFHELLLVLICISGAAAARWLIVEPLAFTSNAF